MKSTRKEFLLGLGAASVAPALPAVGDKVLLKVGVTTDTHFGRPDVKGVERVEKAWRLWKKLGCGLIANCGDIADRFLPEWYEEVCRLRERVFDDPKTAPKEIWVYAGHDRIDMPDDADKRGVGNYALLKEKLRIAHEAYDTLTVSGFTFLVVPQAIDMARYERMVAAACRKSPGKPVFVFDHHPGRGTTENSAVWGDPQRYKMLSKYPQVVHVTGHAHGSLRNEQNIHQGAYTSVSAACLTYFSEPYTGATHAETGQNRSVLVMELYGDHAVIRRYSIDTGEEIGADEPWTISWPYDPKKPFYSRENMRARHDPPQFPSGAALAVETVVKQSPRIASNGPKLKVSFPVTGNRFTRHYRIEAYRPDAARRRVRILRQDIRGEFWKDPERRAPRLEVLLDAAYFTPGEPIEVTVTPCDFWGGEGSPLGWRGRAPAETLKLVWRGDMPKDGNTLPELPPETDGRDVKIVVDLELDQPEGAPAVEVGVKPCDFWWAARLATPQGRSRLTYVFYFYGIKADKRYEFSYRGGTGPWSVRYSNLRIYC